MNTTLKTLIAAAALMAAVATAQAADAPQVRVRYADLNVHTAAGAAVLNHRIQGAAQAVCGDVNDRDPARRVRMNACITTAVTNALATVKASDVQLAALK